MRPIAISAPGTFHRGNLHTRSHRSDGVLSPEEVCRRYVAEGYDFIAMTAHFIGIYGYPVVDAKPFRTNNFTIIPGAELHSESMANGELSHILAVGLSEDFTPPDAPGFAPVEGQESGPEIAAGAIDAAHAVEVYDHGCAVGADRPHGFATLDLLLTEGRRLDLVATADAHFTEPDHFGGWVMVKAEANEPGALLEALKSGAYHSSTAPEIHDISLEGEELEVACPAASSIIVMAQGSAAQARHGASIPHARIALKRVAASPWLSRGGGGRRRAAGLAQPDLA